MYQKAVATDLGPVDTANMAPQEGGRESSPPYSVMFWSVDGSVPSEIAVRLLNRTGGTMFRAFAADPHMHHMAELNCFARDSRYADFIIYLHNATNSNATITRPNDKRSLHWRITGLSPIVKAAECQRSKRRTKYNAIMIDPVTFWAGDDSSVSPEEQQDLCAYFYTKLREQTVKHFAVVDQPGPGVMRLQVAITDVSKEIPVLRTASVVIPQMRLMSRLKQFATGSFSFVGSARGEMKLTDSTNGALLAEALDQQMGGNAIQTAATWQWQDAERAFDHWSEVITTRLNELHTTGTITTSATS